eukprot:CAMPEP_0174369458 /NCGR_PEP_ID=MMETSP0811_2-20130205/92561_1 /TAXON_ID=73025 ORGANISM="Eutreptiella gymnastica-like, Strain CCMP1594" /NCGR_SAMPLE_ID=MMETSP0811_2 /ASSEMBLY_ACC=CAM_ASM_000667 /LENGTH=43 /DNA_ID= /DNA_START= /DNA_END= /DNA_ORIENTATION=
MQTGEAENLFNPSVTWGKATGIGGQGCMHGGQGHVHQDRRPAL